MSREAGWAPKLYHQEGGVSSWKSPGSTLAMAGGPMLLISPQSCAS